MTSVKATDFFSHTVTQISSNATAHVITVDLDYGLTLSVMTFEGADFIEFVADNDQQYLQFSCTLEGFFEVIDGYNTLFLDPGSMLMCYAPKQQFSLRIAPHSRCIEVKISMDKLQHLVGEEFTYVLKKLYKQGMLCPSCYKLQSRQSALALAELVVVGKTSKLRIYAATLEFLSMQLQTCSDQNQCNLPLRTRRQLREAHELLLADLSAPPTIAELALETGLNQLKLKQGFKLMYGDSIYALFLKHRMAKAKELLKNHSVTDAAVSLGYSNISHFSTAFRKQYGLLPSEIKRGVA